MTEKTDKQKLAAWLNAVDTAWTKDSAKARKLNRANQMTVDYGKKLSDLTPEDLELLESFGLSTSLDDIVALEVMKDLNCKPLAKSRTLTQMLKDQLKWLI